MNRRNFLQTAAAPLIIPSHVLGKPGRPGANDRIKVGFIGLGARARWLVRYIGKEVPEAEMVAVADCHLPRCYGKDTATSVRLSASGLAASLCWIDS